MLSFKEQSINGMNVSWFCSPLSDCLLETRVLAECNQLPSLQTEGTACMVSWWKHCLKSEHRLKLCLILQVKVLCNLFNESRSDRQSKEVLGEITDYNKRYSGEPRRVSALLPLLSYPYICVQTSFLYSPPCKTISWCTLLKLLQCNRIPPLSVK